MNHSLPARLQLTTTADQTEKPEILLKIDLYQKAKDCTMLEAAEHVLVEFAKDHPGPEYDAEIDQCEQLIKRLKANRASMQVLQQERRQQKKPVPAHK